uniref:VWFA domain-containing protein n=1 Tax=Brassica oleracea var. oleracea TaxID=109376 RepID=A0A0D3DW17_BRAOL
MLVSSRFRTGSGTTSKTTNRSPGDAHLFPSLLSPLTLNRLPPPELAEQLRLVVEPTIASKLSGDYRTGQNRTNVTTRSVIAVDDSRSMSESGCGEFAIRALATVCRAMSQLEMGNMNEMLENLASTRRHSSGSNPLQQLVLIIGDGKFHEREKLKRSVRKFLQQKRMVVCIYFSMTTLNNPFWI